MGELWVIWNAQSNAKRWVSEWLQHWKWKWSCSVAPWTVAYQAPPSMEFSRQEYWSGLPFPFPGDLPNPRIKPRSPALQADALPSELPGKPIKALYKSIIAKQQLMKWNVFTYDLCSREMEDPVRGHQAEKFIKESQELSVPEVAKIVNELRVDKSTLIGTMISWQKSILASKLQGLRTNI